MGLLRRANREVYRVYSEEEFLSDAATLRDWSVSPVDGASRERRLRRLAGIAALTGAVGTVVGAIAVASVGSRAAGPRITASATPRPSAVRPSSAAKLRAHAIRRAHVGRRGRSRPVDARAARSIVGGRSVLRRQEFDSVSRRSDIPASVGGAVPVETDVSGAAPVETNVSGAAPARPAARSEFGFER